MKFRHSKRDSQVFLFSVKESDEAYYDVAYELTKNLFTGMAKRASAFNSTLCYFTQQHKTFWRYT